MLIQRISTILIEELQKRSRSFEIESCAGSTFRTRARPEKFILTRARPDPPKFNPNPTRPDEV
jgi:hypothetical protein